MPSYNLKIKNEVELNSGKCFLLALINTALLLKLISSYDGGRFEPSYLFLSVLFPIQLSICWIFAKNKERLILKKFTIISSVIYFIVIAIILFMASLSAAWVN